ncbi:MAG TPA: hypothetical protein VIL85_16255 [Thermomicrobiales bacterium]|jgi:hypothetical protein
MSRNIDARKRLAFREWLTITASILVSLAQIATLIWLIWNRTPHLPILDEWEMTNFLELADQERLNLLTFWGFQNEHRIFLPRLILYALIEATGWQRQSIMTFNLGIGVATAALICTVAYQAIGRHLFTIVALPLSLLLFSFAQFENWLFAFQTNFILAAFGIACCLLGVTLKRPRQGFPLALFGALVASLSTLGGLLTWPAFLPAIWRVGRSWTAVWCLCAIAIGIPYVDGFPRGTTPTASIGELLAYGLAYLGAPLGFPTVTLAIAYGAVGLAMMLLNLLGLRLIDGWSIRLMPWLTLGLFALAGMALTTIGRATLGQEQAITSRYQIFSAFWWISLLIVTMMTVAQARTTSRAGKQPASRAFIGVNMLLLSAMLIGLVRADALGFVAARAWQQQQLAQEDCVLHYDTAPDSCLLKYYVSAPIARIHLAFLEQHGLSIFHDQSPAVADLPNNGVALTHFDLVNDQPVGSLTTMVPSTTSLRLTGWAVDSAAASPATAVYILIDNRFTYRVTYGLKRPDVAAELKLPAAVNVGFVAILPEGLLTPGPHTLTVRIIGADRRAYADGARPITIEAR